MLNGVSPGLFRGGCQSGGGVNELLRHRRRIAGIGEKDDQQKHLTCNGR
jgi:hypothetical protein